MAENGCRVVDIVETGYIQVDVTSGSPQVVVGNKNLLDLIDRAWGGRVQFGTVHVTVDLLPQTETTVGLGRDGKQ